MCKVISAKKSAVAATENVTFNQREEKPVSRTAEFKARVYTVNAMFTRPPCPAMILEAQAQAGLPVARHGIFPETVEARTVGGVTVATWKCRA